MDQKYPDIAYIKALIELQMAHKIDILEVKDIKLIKQEHTQAAVESAPIKDMFDDKEPEMTEDEKEELLFAHENF